MLSVLLYPKHRFHSSAGDIFAIDMLDILVILSLLLSEIICV